MDPIDMVPLRPTSPAILMPYGTSEDETPAIGGFRDKKSYPLESQNARSSNLNNNPVQATIETVGNYIESKVDTSSSRENFPIKKQDNQNPNLDESSV